MNRDGVNRDGVNRDGVNRDGVNRDGVNRDGASSDGTRSGGLRSTWPIHRREAGLLLGGYVVLVALWFGFGQLVTGPLADSALTRNDRQLAERMAANRTPAWNDLTLWGSRLAETVTKVAVTAVVALILLRVCKRWLEPVVIMASLAIEAAAFIVVTTLVGRSRPAVQRLDDSPVGSSFPSGHVAAAMAYIAFAVIVFWHTRNRWARGVAVTTVAAIPVIVALSRMYRGMHFFSDVVAGALLGGASVALTVAVIRRSPQGVAALGPTDVAATDEPAMAEQHHTRQLAESTS